MNRPYPIRLTKLRKLLRQEHVPALLVTKFVNVTYLTGFTGDDSYLLVTPDDAIVLSDFRYIEQLQEECPELDVEIRPQGVTMLQLVSQVVRRTKVRGLGVEAESMSIGWYQRLEQSLAKVTLAATTGLVEQLREVKDREELDEIRRSVQVAQKAFEVVRAQLRPALTEQLIAAELEYQIRQFGGRGCSFAPIVAVGSRAALPHAVPTERRMDDSDFVLIDWGAKATRYASDLTRILVTGKISAKLERVYGVVLKAQLRAIEAIRPGARMSDVDAAARTVIAEAGWGKHFGHGLGHGIGLEIHEAPRLAVQQDQPLVAGMVVTVEPGIYLPGWGGVRIEDDVLVTRDGHEVLSDLPKELDRCLVR
jgi:Xaa-Pro aminopeptidase